MPSEVSRFAAPNDSDDPDNMPVVTWHSKEEQSRVPTHLDVKGLLRAGKNKLKKSGELDGRALAIYENKYVVNTGQVVVPVVRTIYLVQVAMKWPELTISPRNFFSRILNKFGYTRGIQLDDPAFNVAFRVKSASEDFAITLLSPVVQKFLLTKRGVTWKVSQGRLALVYGGALKEKKLAASLQRLHDFFQLIPPELDAWGL